MTRGHWPVESIWICRAILSSFQQQPHWQRLFYNRAAPFRRLLHDMMPKDPMKVLLLLLRRKYRPHKTRVRSPLRNSTRSFPIDDSGYHCWIIWSNDNVLHWKIIMIQHDWRFIGSKVGGRFDIVDYRLYMTLVRESMKFGTRRQGKCRILSRNSNQLVSGTVKWTAFIRAGHGIGCLASLHRD